MIVRVSLTVLFFIRGIEGEIASLGQSTDSIRVSWTNPSAPNEGKVILRVESRNASKGGKTCQSNGSTSKLDCAVDGLDKATLYNVYMEFTNGNRTSKETVQVMTAGPDVCKNMDTEMFTIIALAVAVGILVVVVAIMLLCLACRQCDTTERAVEARETRRFEGKRMNDIKLEYKDKDKLATLTPVTTPPPKPPPYKGQISLEKSWSHDNGDIMVNVDNAETYQSNNSYANEEEARANYQW